MLCIVRVRDIAKHARTETGQDSPQKPESSPQPGSHTDPLARPAATEPERTERLEALAFLRKRQVENATASLLNSHQYAPANHPCVKDLSETVRWAAEQLKMSPDSISLHVFKQYPMEHLEESSSGFALEAYLPQAFVIPESGAIFINVQMLEALSWSSHLVHAVLYHEVAHLLLKRDLMAQVAVDQDDPLLAHHEAYEIEHHCDRLAALLSSRRKEDPASIGNALAKLAEAEERILEQSDCSASNAGNAEIPLLMSHPATERRIRENRSIARHLPRTGLAHDSPLAEIENSDLPIKRPFGSMINEANTLGTFSDEARKGTVEEPPMEFGELIQEGQDRLRLDGLEARSDLFSDWFANLCGFLGTEEGDQFKQEFAEELRNSEEATKGALAEVLGNINPARLLSNYMPCDHSWIFDGLLDESFKAAPSDALDLLVMRYLELQDEASGPLARLTDLVELGERGDRKFGIGAVFISSEIVRLCIEVARDGSDEEKTSLVTLVDRSPSLQGALSPRNYGRDKFPDIQSLTTLLRAQSKTMFRSIAPTNLAKSLEAHTLERWIGPPLSSREVCELPICVRREPGSTFEISRRTLRNGRQYDLVIVGDTQLGDKEGDLLKQHLTETIDRGLQTISSRLNVPLPELSGNRSIFLRTIADRVSNIRKTSEHLQALQPKTLEEKRAYMDGNLAAEFGEATNNRTHRAIGEILVATPDDHVDSKLHLDLEFRLRIEGRAAVQDDLVGSNRRHFSQTRYTQSEERSPEHIQHQRLWSELYGTAYASMNVGLDKARLLIESYPIKTCYRDQLICESLELPPLRFLDDMGSISEAIQKEDSIDTLVLLRDSLRSQELAQVAEVRLFKLFKRNSVEFLGHPSIVASLPEALKPLPDVLQRLVVSDERLLGVIMCFAYASRERDRHLVDFRDEANSREEKEALGALFSDPNLASTQGVILFKKRQDADTVFASMAALGPYDKTQALLYFMGRRSFFSPLEKRLSTDRSLEEAVGNRDTPLIPTKTATAFGMPDVLIRAQKAFGIAITTAENLKGGLLNERTLTDLLRETLYGRNGVASEPELLQEFFTLAARTLIQQNPQLEALETVQKRKLAAFLGFAFANCPESRLPSVILKVWEASKRDSKDAPTLVATILSKLGSAFVKFGQRLAQLDIDAEYKRAFRQLCSENAQVDTSFVYHNLSIICPADIFDESCTGRKIAEGSMAATFEGTLKESEKKVCIKMIHPSIRGDIDQDIDYITKLVEYMNREQVFPGLTIPANTPQIVRQQLEDQIDSNLEMERTEHLRKALQSPESGAMKFVVPEVLREVSGEGVIVYEFMPSHELDKEEIRAQGFDAPAISHEVGLEMLRMLVEEKHYQSDVNLGNFGVLKNPESGVIVCDKQGRLTVVWYDAGAVEKIHPDDQKLLLQIVLAAAKNPKEIPDLVSKLVHAEGASTDRVREICAEFGGKLGESGKLELTQLQEQLQEFIDALAKAGVAVQDKWLVIANTLSMAAPLLRGVDEKRLTDVFTKAMQKHRLINRGEVWAMRFMSIWRQPASSSRDLAL